MKFELGQVVQTASVANLRKEDKRFNTFCNISLGKYMKCDWGDTEREDALQNWEAIENGSRILAVYKEKNLGRTIWIITEWDRSVTTILFPEEY